MDEKEVREILEPDTFLKDGGLHDTSRYIRWHKGASSVTLDGIFSIDELEAILWWMRNK